MPIQPHEEWNGEQNKNSASANKVPADGDKQTGPNIQD